jgi:hypothetical protein
MKTTAYVLSEAGHTWPIWRLDLGEIASKPS